jgi:NADH-quinone oxidoreductase subunit A
MDQVVQTNIIYVTRISLGRLFGSARSSCQAVESFVAYPPDRWPHWPADRCGMEPWQRLDSFRYHLLSVCAHLPCFDVDVLFLFPVAVAYNSPELGVRDFSKSCCSSFLSLAISMRGVKECSRGRRKRTSSIVQFAKL